MSARTLISVEDYLATAYEPDCDFVDGHIEERNVGEVRALVSAALHHPQEQFRVRGGAADAAGQDDGAAAGRPGL